jgi:hypothetical protein
MLSPTETLSVFFTLIVDFSISILFYMYILRWLGSCLSVVQRGDDAVRQFQISCQVVRPKVLFTVREKGEKMLSKILRVAVLATFAVGATGAHADPFDGSADGMLKWDGYTNNYLTVTTNRGTFHSGQFKGYFDPGSATAPNTYEPDDFFRFFCIDLAQGVGEGLYTRSEGVANGADSAQLTRLYDLYYPPIPHPNPGVHYFPSAPTTFGVFGSTLESAAMQLAVWEIWYGNDLDLTQNGADGFYWTGAGGCGSDPNTVCGRAQQMLNGVATANGDLSGTWRLYQFESGRFQNYLSATYTRSSGDVPLPGTLALFGIGLAGLGLARRKS